MSKSIDFTVTGEHTIHCASCEQRIGNALRRLDGIQDVQASAQTQKVAVRFDLTEVRPEDIQAKLAQMGYVVSGGSV